MGASGEPEILKRCRKVAFLPLRVGTSPESRTAPAQDLPQIPSPPCPSPEGRLQELSPSITAR